MTKRGRYLLSLSFSLSSSCGRGMLLRSSALSTSSPHLEFSLESKQLVLRWSCQEAGLEGGRKGGRERKGREEGSDTYMESLPPGPKGPV